MPNSDVFGNGRPVTLFFLIFSLAVIMFTWLVPKENRNSHVLIATIFIFNLNLYVFLPLLNIIKNEKLRSFPAKKLDQFLDPAKKILAAFSSSRQVTPVD